MSTYIHMSTYKYGVCIHMSTYRYAESYRSIWIHKLVYVEFCARDSVHTLTFTLSLGILRFQSLCN